MKNRHLLPALLASASLLACIPSGPKDLGSRFVKETPVTAADGATITVSASDSEVLAGLVLEVPAGALSEDTTITVARHPEDVVLAPATPAGPAVDLGPDGLVFDGGASLTLPLTLTDKSLAPYVFLEIHEANGDVLTLYQPDVSLDLTSGTLTATIPGFSRFQPGIARCETGDDCLAGESCVAGLCERACTCTADADCAAGDRCSSCQCVPDSTACAANSDCASGERCVGGACEPDTTACASNADCANTELCVSGACVLDTGSSCTTDRDCTLVDDYCEGCNCLALGPNEGAPGCGGNTVSCFVEPCLGYAAACIQGLCYAKSTGAGACASDADCPPGDLCTGGTCVAGTGSVCQANSDCGTGEVCLNGACTTDTSAGCTTIDPMAYGACTAVLGVAWDGRSCVTVSGCGCGADCASFYNTQAECESACGGGATSCASDLDCASGQSCQSGVCTG